MPIQEEDEEEEESAIRDQSFDNHELDAESIEEVDQFSPVIRAPGEMIEEIYEAEEETPIVHQAKLEQEKKEHAAAASTAA